MASVDSRDRNSSSYWLLKYGKSELVCKYEMWTWFAVQKKEKDNLSFKNDYLSK